MAKRQKSQDELNERIEALEDIRDGGSARSHIVEFTGKIAMALADTGAAPINSKLSEVHTALVGLPGVDSAEVRDVRVQRLANLSDLDSFETVEDDEIGQRFGNIDPTDVGGTAADESTADEEVDVEDDEVGDNQTRSGA